MGGCGPVIVSAITTFRIIVITYNRPYFLHTLLRTGFKYNTQMSWQLQKIIQLLIKAAIFRLLII